MNSSRFVLCRGSKRVETRERGSSGCRIQDVCLVLLWDGEIHLPIPTLGKHEYRVGRYVEAPVRECTPSACQVAQPGSARSSIKTAQLA